MSAICLPLVVRWNILYASIAALNAAAKSQCHITRLGCTVTYTLLAYKKLSRQAISKNTLYAPRLLVLVRHPMRLHGAWNAPTCQSCSLAAGHAVLGRWHWAFLRKDSRRRLYMQAGLACKPSIPRGHEQHVPTLPSC